MAEEIELKDKEYYFSFKEGDLLLIETFQFTEYSDTGDEEPTFHTGIVLQVENDESNEDWIHYHLHTSSDSQVTSIHYDSGYDEWFINYEFDVCVTTGVTRMNEDELSRRRLMDSYNGVKRVPRYILGHSINPYKELPSVLTFDAKQGQTNE
jgi:hypothetical protein